MAPGDRRLAAPPYEFMVVKPVIGVTDSYDMVYVVSLPFFPHPGLVLQDEIYGEEVVSFVEFHSIGGVGSGVPLIICEADTVALEKEMDAPGIDYLSPQVQLYINKGWSKVDKKTFFKDQ